MKVVRKSLAGLGLGIALSAAFVVGGSLIKDVQFARAQQQVEATRQQIANIQDMAAVYKAVGKAVEPSVVSIEVRKTVDNPNLRRFFQQDRNGDGVPDAPIEQGTGSGVIIDVDGKTAYIVTNNHVAGGATELTVLLHDGREIHNAKVVGTDPKTDVAVIKIESERLIPAKWGNSDALEKGDIVMAFGSPFGYVGSMTHGIVSALHRQTLMSERNKFSYENFIQVDAPINPGNSGGPLVNLKGEVVGINTAIATESGGFQGLGFAIPATQAKFVVDAIREKGRVVRGYLGVGIGDVAKQPELAASLGFSNDSGIIVSQIFNKTPAAGKLQQGDVITTLNEKKVATVQELRNQVAAMPPGTDVKLGVFRRGKAEDVTVKLGEQPEEASPVAAATPPDARATPGQASAENLGLTRLASPSDETTQRFSLDAGLQGAVVMTVRAGSIAFLSGLRTGDVITQIDDTPIKSADDAREVFTKKDPIKGMKVYITNNDGSSLVFLRAEK